MEDTEKKSFHPRFFTSEMLLLTVAILAGVVVLWTSVAGQGSVTAQIIAGVTFTISLLGVIRLEMDPDSVRARQTDEVLTISSQTLASMKNGFTEEAAQHICDLILPATAAIAVAITDREKIKGYAGYNADNNPPGAPIRTTATHETLEDGKGRILLNRDEIGLPSSSVNINAAIVMPLFVGSKIAGTLKFYYRKSSHISQTQKSLAEGFGELISTQMAASALEEQTKLATSLELKALQAQINPHFLFNTLNTITSFVRTDPNKARSLLREFAAFYRSTLEDANDLIPLEREIEQVKRYFGFEVARFGEESLELVIDVSPQLMQVEVPSFMIQPLVENAVRHGRAADRKLTVTVSGAYVDDNVIIKVIDDGLGMKEETLQTIMHPESSQGLGIAVKNVRDRMRGYFGADATMWVSSQEGQGTEVTFTLPKADMEGYIDASDITSQAQPLPDLPLF